ncbi:MAG: PrsW family intramembrane metalloprotease [Dysgonamonadaceae bacterium]|jgi:RsiW-degrading membrane proteinase PrsW (M82 family)|nr:PrsW family intramembrane metalloprotease [Dysgonamonadaceae bacterium]
MMIIPILIILSVAPSAIILLWLYKKDKYEQEPLPLLLQSFGLGALSTICVIVLFSIIGLIIPIEPNTGNHFADALIEAFFTAAIPEELLKFLFLYLLIWKNQNFSERFDGIIYAVFVSMGFAALENIIYVLQSGAGTAIARALTAVPAHALFGVAMGFYFSYAKFLPERKNKYLALCVGVPVLLHGVYDFILMWQEKLFEHYPEISILLTLAFIAFVVFLWIQGFKKIKKLSADFYFQGIPQNEIQEYLNAQNCEEVAASNLPPPPATPTYLRNWQEVTPQLFEYEKNAVLEKYPDALLETDDGLVTVGLVTEGNHQWLLQLTYARNYRKQKAQLRIYVIEPDLNELAAISNEIPYIKTDLSGQYYLDVAPQNQPSGVRAIDNALLWIGLFEKWVNEEIELNEFVIN